jgi:hypothetical protein
MPPKKPKISTDRAEPSTAAAIIAAADAIARGNTAATTEPPRPQPEPDGAAATRGREETPEGDIEEVELDQNGKEIEDDEDDEITEQAKDLKRLDQYQQDILRLQHKKGTAAEASYRTKQGRANAASNQAS